MLVVQPETHTKRQATQHGLLGNGDKVIAIVCGEEKVFSTAPTTCTLEQPRLNKNLLYRHDKPSESIKEGPL